MEQKPSERSLQQGNNIKDAVNARGNGTRKRRYHQPRIALGKVFTQGSLKLLHLKTLVTLLGRSSLPSLQDKQLRLHLNSQPCSLTRDHLTPRNPAAANQRRGRRPANRMPKQLRTPPLRNSPASTGSSLA
uniref:Uncharacterized protein n=1 Tax=Oryza barthii TaxID=65489 RepID=A0A0D3GMW4_9ORYZ